MINYILMPIFLVTPFPEKETVTDVFYLCSLSTYLSGKQKKISIITINHVHICIAEIPQEINKFR